MQREPSTTELLNEASSRKLLPGDVQTQASLPAAAWVLRRVKGVRQGRGQVTWVLGGHNATSAQKHKATSCVIAGLCCCATHACTDRGSEILRKG